MDAKDAKSLRGLGGSTLALAVMLLSTLVLLSPEAALSAEPSADAVVQEEMVQALPEEKSASKLLHALTTDPLSTLYPGRPATAAALKGLMTGKAGQLSPFTTKEAQQMLKLRMAQAKAESAVPNKALFPKKVEPPGYLPHTQKLQMQERDNKEKGKRIKREMDEAIAGQKKSAKIAAAKIAKAMKKTRAKQEDLVKWAKKRVKEHTVKSLEKQKAAEQASAKVLAKKHELGVKKLKDMKAQIMRDAAKEKKKKADLWHQKQVAQAEKDTKAEKQRDALRKKLEQTKIKLAAEQKKRKKEVKELTAKSEALAKKVGKFTELSKKWKAHSKDQSKDHKARQAQRAKMYETDAKRAKGKEVEMKGEIKKIKDDGLAKIKAAKAKMAAMQKQMDGMTPVPAPAPAATPATPAPAKAAAK